MPLTLTYNVYNATLSALFVGKFNSHNVMQELKKQKKQNWRVSCLLSEISKLKNPAQSRQNYSKY